MAMAFRVSPALLHDRVCQQMPARMFRLKVLAAIEGEENEFSRFVRPEPERPCASEWSRLRAAVFARDDYTCSYCGARGVRLECDHVIPVSRGGPSEMSNLATACFPCNRSKRNRTPSEWQDA